MTKLQQALNDGVMEIIVCSICEFFFFFFFFNFLRIEIPCGISLYFFSENIIKNYLGSYTYLISSAGCFPILAALLVVLETTLLCYSHMYRIKPDTRNLSLFALVLTPCRFLITE